MKRVLNAGAGKSAPIPDGYKNGDWQIVTLDVDPTERPDIVASVVDIPEPNASYDAVFCSHTLEHLYPHHVPLALAEFRRVLRPGGWCVVVVPDLAKVCQLIVTGQEERSVLAVVTSDVEQTNITAMDMLFGHRGSIANGRPWMAHHTGFTRGTLHALMERAGFSPVETHNGNNLYNLYGIGYAKQTRGSIEAAGDPARDEAQIGAV